MTEVRLGNRVLKRFVPVRVSVLSNIFIISLTFVKVPMVPMAQWVGQKGFEAVGTGSNPSLCLRSST